MTDQQRGSREDLNYNNSFHKTPFYNTSARAIACVLIHETDFWPESTANNVYA